MSLERDRWCIPRSDQHQLPRRTRRTRRGPQPTRPMDIELVAKEIVDSAIKVHSALGPGLLESAYNACLAYELRKRGLRVRTEVPLPVIYDGFKVDLGYRI